MIAEAHDQERLVREIALQPLDERLVVMRAHVLPAQIFVDAVAFDVAVAEVAPVGGQLVAIAVRPGEMVGHQIGEDEHRPLRAVALQQIGGEGVIEFVRLDVAGLEVLGVVEVIDAERLLEIARAEKSAEPGIDAVGAIAAVVQRVRQAPRDAARRRSASRTRRNGRRSAPTVRSARCIRCTRSARPRLRPGTCAPCHRTNGSGSDSRRGTLTPGTRADVEARTRRARGRCAAAAAPACRPRGAADDKAIARRCCRIPEGRASRDRTARARLSARTATHSRSTSNAFSRSIGTASDRPVSAARQPTAPSAATRNRTRIGSSHQNSASSGSADPAAARDLPAQIGKDRQQE